MKNLNLIRKIAWSFAKTTGLEFDELFSEASLAYVESLRSYNPEKARLSTWAVKIMTNRLITFCMNQDIFVNLPEFFEDIFPGQSNTEEEYLFKDWILCLPQDLQLICKIVLETPEEVLAESPKASRGKIIEKLRSLKWSWPRIWNGIRNIKIALNEKEEFSII